MADEERPPAQVSPDELEPKPKQVRRFNQLPVFIILSLILIVLAVFGMIATRRPEPREAVNPAEEPADFSAAEDLARRAARLRAQQQREPVVLPRRELPQTAPPPRRTLRREERPPQPKQVIVQAFHNPPPGAARLVDDEDTGRASTARARFPSAGAPVSGSAPGTGGSGPAIGPGPAEGVAAQPDLRNELFANDQADAFLDRARADQESPYVIAARERALSRFEIKAGTLIPAILQTQIVSDLPGPVTAVVRQDVYDSIGGKYLLVPRGSKLIGEYNSRVVWGEKRVLLAFQRIIFPDGSSLPLQGMPGVDGLGAAGLHDQVNNHYLRIFGHALLLSVITAGVEIATDDDNDNIFDRSDDAGDALSRAVGNELALTSSLILRRNLNIAPTLSVRPGFLFAIAVTRDFAFSEPYYAMEPGG